MKHYLTILLEIVVVIVAVVVVGVWWEKAYNSSSISASAISAIQNTTSTSTSSVVISSSTTTALISPSVSNQASSTLVESSSTPILKTPISKKTTPKKQVVLTAATSSSSPSIQSTSSTDSTTTTASTSTKTATSTNSYVNPYLPENAPAVIVDATTPIVNSTTTPIKKDVVFLRLNLPTDYLITNVDYSIESYETNTILGTLVIGQQLMSTQTDLTIAKYLNARFATGLNYVDFSANNFNYLGQFRIIITDVEGTKDGFDFTYKGTPITTGWFQLAADTY